MRAEKKLYLDKMVNRDSTQQVGVSVWVSVCRRRCRRWSRGVRSDCVGAFVSVSPSVPMSSCGHDTVTLSNHDSDDFTVAKYKVSHHQPDNNSADQQRRLSRPSNQPITTTNSPKTNKHDRNRPTANTMQHTTHPRSQHNQHTSTATTAARQQKQTIQPSFQPITQPPPNTARLHHHGPPPRPPSTRSWASRR
jgi:hypothetical protein